MSVMFATSIQIPSESIAFFLVLLVSSGDGNMLDGILFTFERDY